ncbi:hypothetical protein PAXRUDRAFT_176393, partial [Paxillus rubicundulus Ve08.2h10]
KFLTLFNDIQDAINAAQYLCKHRPPEMRDKIKWFNSDMTMTYKETELKNLVLGKTFGLCTTDSFGMVSKDIILYSNGITYHIMHWWQGMDVVDIIMIIQW